MDNFIREFKSLEAKGVLLENEPMSLHTTFKIGGPADVFFIPETEADFLKAVKTAVKTGVAYYIMGNGSNLLVSDDGLRGVVISTAGGLRGIAISEGGVCAASGELLPAIASFCAQNGLSGLEPISGVPGTLGGAVFMNAGAYDLEIRDILESARVMDENGEIFKLKNEDFNFGYRKSALQSGKLFLLSAVLAVKPGDAEEIKSRMLDFKKRRQDKQPIDLPNAGSTFKRPPGKYVGQLIMSGGLSGFSVGGARISEKHCGFIINTGGATARDVLNLVEHVKKTVFETHGVSLESEIKFWGDF